MKGLSWFLLPLFLLGGCGIFGGTSAKEERLSGFFSRAKGYYQNDRLQQALDQVDRGLELSPGDPKFLTLKGFIFLKYARRDPSFYDDALALFRKAASGGLFSSGLTRAKLGLGLALLGRGIKERDYASNLEKALLEGSIPASRREEARKKVPRMRDFARKDFKEAESAFEAVLGEEPRNILALYSLALVKVALDKKEEGLKLIERYIRVAAARRRQILDRDLKITLSKEGEDRLWKELRTIESREKECRGLAANLLYKLGRYKDALKELDTLLKLDPNRVNEYFNRARVHAKLGQVQDAVKDYQTFVGRSLLPREDPRIKEAVDYIARNKLGEH